MTALSDQLVWRGRSTESASAVRAVLSGFIPSEAGKLHCTLLCCLGVQFSDQSYILYFGIVLTWQCFTLTYQLHALGS